MIDGTIVVALLTVLAANAPSERPAVHGRWPGCSRPRRPPSTSPTLPTGRSRTTPPPVMATVQPPATTNKACFRVETSAAPTNPKQREPRSLDTELRRFALKRIGEEVH